MDKTLLDTLKKGGKAQLLSWGRHEGIRGAVWLQFHADGRLIEQRYIPNQNGSVTNTLLGHLSPERFNDLVKKVASIPADDLFRDATGVDPSYLVTLECICDQTAWQWKIVPSEIAQRDSLKQLANAFSSLVSELPK